MSSKRSPRPEPKFEYPIKEEGEEESSSDGVRDEKETQISVGICSLEVLKASNKIESNKDLEIVNH